MNSARFSTAISGVLVRNQPTTGRTSIKWYPKFASESLGGLAKAFAADSIKVSIDNVRVEVSE